MKRLALLIFLAGCLPLALRVSASVLANDATLTVARSPSTSIRSTPSMIRSLLDGRSTTFLSTRERSCDELIRSAGE